LTRRQKRAVFLKWHRSRPNFSTSRVLCVQGLSDPPRDVLFLSSDSSSPADLQRCGYGRKAGFYLCWDLHPVKNSFSCVGESLQESNRIVAVGGDHELLWLRNAVLQSAGFNGLTTEDANAAL